MCEREGGSQDMEEGMRKEYGVPAIRKDHVVAVVPARGRLWAEEEGK